MKQKIIISLVSVFLMLVLSTQVNAADITPTFSHRYTRGVSNTCYYIDSTASQYANRINGAANNWEVTGYGYNPIYMTQVSSNKGTHMDFYGRNDAFFGAGEGIVAVTLPYNADGVNVNPKTTDWSYTITYINIDDLPLYTVADQQGTMAHEMGHSFGLDEYYGKPYSIMYPYISTSMTSVVAECDHNAINLLYN